MKFLDRTAELSLLKKVGRKRGAQFIVLYGRRRIGKTALITHWLETSVKGDAIYWCAHKSSPGMLLEKFSRTIQPCIAGISEDFRFNDWESAIRQVFHSAKERRIVLAIDEFPYLMESVPEFASLLQMLWDEHAKDSRLILLLCGSHYHMMHAEFISGKGPLFGRSTADILLEEIEPDGIHLFLPRYSKEQVVETFSMVGGVPKYLEMWDDRKSVLTNIKEQILSPVTIFRQEALFLIQDEISEPRTYLAILEGIGRGFKTPIEISRQTGIVINHMGKYLRSLLDLGFIRRIISLDSPDRSNTRLSRYEIKDSYLRFYFSFIYPNLDLLEQRRHARLMEIIKENYASYVGRTGFEELARRHVGQVGDRHELSFIPEDVGRIWSRSEEIDVAAIDRRSRNILLGECRWTGRKMDSPALNRLIEKSKSIARIKDYRTQFALFSKSGFTSPLLKRAKKEDILLFEGPQFKSPR